jgi:preprotein translocase subunit YajC
MITPAWAQAGPAGAPPPLMQFAPLVLIFVVFYFLLIRPQQQKAKDQRAMLANLKRNDDVITAGGLYGKIMALTDKIVTLEIAPNVRVRVDRQQIASMTKAGPAEESNGKEKDKSK